MATNKNIVDPTQTGTSGLSGINTKEGRERLLKELGLSTSMSEFKVNKANAPIEQPFQEVGFEGVGASRYDKKISSLTQLENLPNTRGELQPWYDQIGAGIAKGATLAGTTFLDGTVGTIVGAINFLGNLDKGFTQASASFWDNPFAKAMKQVNDWSEEALPNYMTDIEKQNQESGEWYKNMFTANWWGNSFIKNLGFTAGAFATGNLVSGALKGSSAMVKSVVGSAISAINEGKVEAYNNATDWYNLEVQKLKDARDAELAELKQNYEFSDIYNDLVESVNDTYEQSLVKLNEDRAHIGNIDLVSNIALLTASNWYMWGKLYAGGAKSAIKNAKIALRDGKYKNIVTPAKVIFGPVSEGAEEMEQKIAGTIPGLKYGSEIENFYLSQWDPEASSDTMNWWKSTMQGIGDTVGDKASWEEFTIGAITGAMGMPMFRSARTEDGKFRSPITIEGGIIGETRDYLKDKKETQAMVDALNKRVSDPNFQNYYKGMVRHTKYQNDMNEAAVNGNVKSYKDAEDSQFISDIIMFDKAGRLGDIEEMINQAFDTSDENIEEIVKATTDESGNGTYSDNGNPKPKEEIVRKLTDAKDNILNQLKDYREVKDKINILAGDKLNDDQLQELVWLGSKSKAFENRFNAVAEEVKTQIRTVAADINNKYFDKLDIAEDLKFLISQDNDTVIQALNNPENKQQKEALIDYARELKKSFNLDWNDLGQKIEDMTKLAESKNEFDKKLFEYLTSPEKLQKDLDAQKEEVANVEIQKQKAEALNSVNNATSFSALQDAIANPLVDKELLNKSGNSLVKEYNKAMRLKNEVDEAIDNSEYSDEDKEALHNLMNSRIATEGSYSDLSNSKIITEVEVPVEGSTIDIGNALSEFIDVAKAKVDNSVIPDDIDLSFREEKGLDSSTTGNDETPSIPTDKGSNELLKLSDSLEARTQADFFKDVMKPEIMAANELLKTTLSNPSDENINKLRKALNGIESDIYSIPESADEEFAKQMLDIIDEVRSKFATSNPSVSEEELLQSSESDPEMQAARTESQNLNKDGHYEFYRNAVTEYTLESFYDKSGNLIPFNVSNPEMEELYRKINYDYVNKGNIKVGDTINIKLEKIGEYEDLMMYHNGTCVGVLPADGDSKYIGIKSIREKLSKGEEPTLTVSKVMLGKYKFNPTRTQSVKDIAGLGDNVMFAVMSPIKGHPTLVTNSDVATEPAYDELHADGRVYLLLDNGRGTKSPKKLGIKHFNKEEFDLEKLKDSANTRAKEIHDIITEMSTNVNPDKMDDLFVRLGRVLHTKGLLHMNIVTMGNNTVLVMNSKDGERKTFPLVRRNIAAGAIEFGGSNSEPTAVESDEKIANPTDVYNFILNYLYSINTVFNIRASKVNRGDYNKNLIADDILYTHITDAEMTGTWFTTTWYNDEGVEQKAKNPKGVFTVNSKKEGTTVTVGDKEYFVTKGVVYDRLQNEVTGDTKLIKDLAYCEELYGSKTNGINMYNNKVILPGGKEGIDRTTQKYLTAKELDELKAKIDGRPSAIEKMNSTLRVLDENQKKVKRDELGRPDTSENESGESVYRILEDDGQYHEYRRVHSVIGNNWINTDGRSKQAGENALKWGNMIDDICREFFDGVEVKKPDGMTEAAFNSLIKRLNEVKAHLEDTGSKLITKRIVLFKKLPDGTRVAGELDALGYNTITGNFTIYDFKTSRNTFHAKGNSIDKYRTVYHRNETRSTYEQHQLQLSAYKNMFDSTYDSAISSLWVMPFTLNYSGQQSLNQVVGEQAIPIPYRAENPLNTGVPTKPTVAPVTDPASSVLVSDTAPFETPSQSQGETSYFEIDNKVRTGSTIKIGEIEGCEIRMYKEPIKTSGLGESGKGETTLYNVYAVFPNGATFKFYDLVSEESHPDARLSVNIMKALNTNPKKVVQTSSIVTKVGTYKPQPSTTSKLKASKARLESTNKTIERGTMNNIAPSPEKLQVDTTPKSSLDWDKLTDEEQNILNISGYDKYSWNDLPEKEKDAAFNCLNI